jgi:hypothetical protein
MRFLRVIDAVHGTTCVCARMTCIQPSAFELLWGQPPERAPRSRQNTNQRDYWFRQVYIYRVLFFIVFGYISRAPCRFGFNCVDGIVSEAYPCRVPCLCRTISGVWGVPNIVFCFHPLWQACGGSLKVDHDVVCICLPLFGVRAFQFARWPRVGHALVARWSRSGRPLVIWTSLDSN